MFEDILKGRSRAQRAALSLEDQQEVDRLINLIELDPWHDDVHKAAFDMPPVVISVYDNGTWRIAYRVADNAFIEVYAIGRVT